MGLEVIGNEEPLTWKKFEEHIQDDIQSVKPHYSQWVYRGLSNAKWSLETSLERFLRDELSQNPDTYCAKKYYHYLSSIVPAINSLTAQRFPRFSHHNISLPRGEFVRLPQYRLLCFARHHGFPTPLLDWTASYYVAAFFAFRHAKPNQNVAVFAYQEWKERTRGGVIDLAGPTIHQQAPYVVTHHRHYRQQSIYTVCVGYIDTKAVFMKHDRAVEKFPDIHHMKKFILDGKEKEDVLRKLFMMNINEYTLFGDDESLMRMLAFKEFRDIDFLIKRD